MAKLSAHGTERFRLVKSKSSSRSDLTSEECITVSIRSDGSVLTKLDVKFKPDSFNPAGFWHSYGWKKRLGRTEAAARRLNPEKLRDAYLEHGYLIAGKHV